MTEESKDDKLQLGRIIYFNTVGASWCFEIYAGTDGSGDEYRILDGDKAKCNIIILTLLSKSCAYF
jgi:hypothetical protein